MFKKLSSATGFVLEAAVVLCSVAVVSLTVFLVLSRYVFGWSLVGVLEIVMVFAIWLYMAGALVASRNGKHLEVDLLALSIKDVKLGLFHNLYVSGITAIICCFFIYWSYHMMAWGIKLPQSTPGLSIPLLIPELAIFVASVGSLAYALRDFLNAIKNIKGQGER